MLEVKFCCPEVFLEFMSNQVNKAGKDNSTVDKAVFEISAKVVPSPRFFISWIFNRTL